MKMDNLDAKTSPIASTASAASTETTQAPGPSAASIAPGAEEYKYGFTTDVEMEKFGKGLSEDVIRAISRKKNEPPFLLEFRLKAYKKWLTMKEPNWAHVQYPAIDYQDIVYFAEPKKRPTLTGLDEVDPEILKTFEKLGIPLDEQKRLSNVAVDAVFDSVSVATTHKKKLLESGVIFCSISEAVHEYPELIEEYLGSVVPVGDNFYAALNSAVFTDGSFVYIPPGTKCPMELSTYFRINTEESGQFERTLIICAEGSYVSYLEGCTAPKFDTNQLHAAVVELVTLDNAEIKYSTVQNWYSGDPVTGKGGIYNFVTKRGKCLGKKSKISWTQVETGSAITWKYPSCILVGDESVGEFYSVALTSRAYAGGHRLQDDPPGQEHEVQHHIQGHRFGLQQQRLPRPGPHRQERHRLAQLLPMRQHARGPQFQRPYLPLHRNRQRRLPGGARGVHLQDQRGSAVLLPVPGRSAGRSHQHDRERVLQGRVQPAADGVRGGSAEAFVAEA